MTAPALHAFKQVIGQRCGLVFAGPAEDTLADAVARRIAATGAHGPSGYFTHLLADEAEFQELVALLTINETYFFREAHHLALLTDRLIPRLLAQRVGGLPLRILSAGCSTGEEPYSIAIALLERFGEAAGSLCSIVAGDIDHQALARARTARYSAYSFRGVAEDVKERWFRRDGDELVVDARARALVSFYPLNLLSRDGPAALSGLDVVFFRNVSIYFDPPTRRTIQANLHRRMNDPAFLVVGGSETLANDLGLMALEEDGGRFYFAKCGTPAASGPSRAPAPMPRPTLEPALEPALEGGPVSPPPKAVPLVSPPPIPDGRVEAVCALLRAKRYADAAEGLAALRHDAPDDVRPMLLEGWRHLQQHAYDEALALAEAALRHDAWSIEACVLLGFVARRQGDPEEALRRFKQAAYARYDCWPVHYYLAETHRTAGRAEPARRSYRIALQQLSEHPDPDGGLLLPLDLPLSEVRLLCAHHGGIASAIAAR